MASIETTPALLPDGASHLSDGVVVETTLRAALLGVRLLRVDGVVLVSPARLVGREPEPTSLGGSSVPSRVSAADQVANGSALAEAARLLRDNEARLQRLR